MLGSGIGIDLGTSVTTIYEDGKGIVLSEPSVVAYDKDDKIIAIGKKAFDMIGKSSENVRVVTPVRNGVVSDFTGAKHMLQYYLSKVCRNMVFKPDVMVSVPSSVSGLEKRTVFDLATAAGAARVCVIEEPLAAALGAGIENDKPKGTMVVDIGSGSTDIAVITMGCIAASASTNVAGDSLNEAIMRMLRRERDMVIGEKTAETLKTKIGSAVLRDVELGMTVSGKNYITGMPATFEVSSTEVYLAMRPQLESIIESVRSLLETITPELSADIIDSGIVLTGGGSQLRKISDMFTKKLGIRTKVAVDAADCVALGTGRALDRMDILSKNGYVFMSRDEVSGLDEARND